MKRLLLGGAVFFATFAMAPVASAQYAAIAGGYGAIGTADGYGSMESARAAAVAECRQRGGGSCSKSTAERSHWYFSVGYCNGEPYTGASPQGAGRAEQIVRAKGAADGYGNCYIEYTF